MSFELNARIKLPAAMGSAQICELNIGRYNSLDTCREDFSKASGEQPRIVTHVRSALAAHFAEEDGSEVSLVVEYFIRG